MSRLDLTLEDVTFAHMCKCTYVYIRATIASNTSQCILLEQQMLQFFSRSLLLSSPPLEPENCLLLSCRTEKLWKGIGIGEQCNGEAQIYAFRQRQYMNVRKCTNVEWREAHERGRETLHNSRTTKYGPGTRCVEFWTELAAYQYHKVKVATNGHSRRVEKFYSEFW